jgi:putative SOS response-associated peptidase YedK
MAEPHIGDAATCGDIARLPTLREAYQKRRCILPVDGFYEWRETKQGKQPYAIAMKDRSPFGIAALW